MKSWPSADAGVFFGPAGWSYPDWKGRVYPRPAPRGFDPLEYLARFFDVVEVNASFYRPLPAKWTRSWLERVEDHPSFRFTAKLWRRFTHQRDRPPSRDDVDAYREGVDALAEADRLLAVLVQFPWSFRNRAEERGWLGHVVDTFQEYPLVLEVRHASWDEPETLTWLGERGVSLATIDQPLHTDAIAPVVRRTGPIAYHRLHGRNFEAWFAEGRPGHERYNYLYDDAELAPWVDRLREARDDPEVESVVTVTNNHYQGQAVINALQMQSAFSGRRVAVPEPLRKAYAEIAAVIATDEEQTTLFEKG